MNYTPGPWTMWTIAYPTNTISYIKVMAPHECGTVAHVAECGGGAVENARLIAAAPELLEACTMAAASDSFVRLNGAAQRAIREAIAKATEG